MIRKSRGETKWLEFHLLQGMNVRHGVFLRRDPVETGEMQREPKDIIEAKEFISLNQVHGKEIVIAEEVLEIPSADGVMTKKKGMGLVIRHADCQPAIFFDPIEEVIACVHAGWRGLVHNIYQNCIQMLETKFHVNRENLLVCIGPSLEPKHSEFIHYKEEFPESFWRFQVEPNYFDLWEIAKWQLKEEGVLLHHIEIAGIGTYGNPTDFYSYRRTKEKTGHETVCMLY